jgi:hypothetical protein
MTQAKSKLFGFFKSRPSAETLKERGILREGTSISFSFFIQCYIDLVFGGLLELTVKTENRKIPVVIEQCISQVEQRGMDLVGIYRLSGNAATIQKLRFLYNESNHPNTDKTKKCLVSHTIVLR